MSRNFELLNQMGKMQDVLAANKAEIPVVAAAGPVAAPEAGTVVPLLPLEEMARDEINKLVHRLFRTSTTEGPRCVVLTCPESGGGTTWMCAHVADLLASQVSGSVCVVDCNFRSPALHQQFGVENKLGLGDALRVSRPIREYVQHLRANLWMITSGNSSEDAQQWLISDRMRARLAELRATFDYVLLDSPPLSLCNHGLVLGGLSDGVALVLKANSTRRDAARLAVQELQAAKTPVLGAVLNQRTFPIPDTIYNRLNPGRMTY
ncbi:putative Non-specific protein-tyrosine kinase [Candidatus Sulfotelmatobacter kueseliae]|uniref:Putative Non-specific protein-tyrosine kinase n=1 Tax=Candidatus Sulfotelmatobacter kueseliae TaxID=2042962 RepID=A0A2U3KW48_9BACT|nr:putative Non-specific protein-tyrosine kinase [Candidatus Sulfotelmatobacter kueseliae]